MKLKLIIGLLVFATTTKFSFAQRTHKTKNLVIVLIDGYRWQELFNGAQQDLLTSKAYNPKSSSDSITRLEKFWTADVLQRREKLMPFTWDYIAKHGQIYGNRALGNLVNVKNPYWFSAPGRAENLSGFVDLKINTNSYPDNPNMNVLAFINQQQGYQGKVASFACWDEVAHVINRDKYKMLVNIPYDDIKGKHLSVAEKIANEIQHFEPDVFGPSERLDVNVYALAKAYIFAHHPRVTYIDFGDTDDYAHEGKYNLYLTAASNIDAMLQLLWEDMQKDPFYKNNTTLIVMPDHGRGQGSQWTSHGTSAAHSDQTWFMVMGPDTPALGEVKTKEQIYQTRYASTIANFLGLDYHVEGQTIGAPISSVMNK